MDERDVHIGDVVVDLHVTDGVGPLAPDEVRALVRLVVDQVRRELRLEAERERDTTVHDRVFRPEVP